tara:strand:+ start:370 stop:2154 length:1785 start_codon:yes stop_codon:yes gene_type:complete
MNWKNNFLFDYVKFFKILLEKTDGSFWLIIVLSVTVAILDGFGITLVLPLIESNDVLEDDSLIVRLIAFTGLLDLPFSNLLFIIGLIFFVKGSIKFSSNWIIGKIAKGIIIKIKSGLLKKYSRVDYKYFISRDSGYFTNLLNTQADETLNFLSRFSALNGFIATVLIYIIIAFLIDWQFTLLAIGIGFVLLFLMRGLSVMTKQLSVKVSEENGVLNKLLIQVIQQFKFLRSTGRFDIINKQVEDSVKRLAKYRYKNRVAFGFSESIAEPLVIAILMLLIYVQVVLLGKSIGPLLVTLLLFYRTLNNLFLVQNTWQDTLNRVGSVEMIYGEMKKVHEKEEIDGTQIMEGFSQKIVFDNVFFAYHEKPVLNCINLEISKNETVAIVGPSGSGKSTLVDLVTLNLKPNRGSIIIDGVDSKKIKLSSWRSQIGYITQDLAIFNDTIVNNITCWEETLDHQRLIDATKKANCFEFINAMENKFETQIGERGVRLSGGQKQRIAIARELYKRPNILIMDEATSALDTESEQLIQQSLDSIKGEITLIIIAHRLSTLRNVDKIFVIDSLGSMVEQGSYSKLIKKNAHFASLVNKQQLWVDN